MKRKLAIGAVLVVVAGAAAGTYAWAASSAAQTINACVGSDGKVRVVALVGDCKNGETALSWNSEGPAGPAGPPGATGAPGPAGPPGAAAANPDATTATMDVVGAQHGEFSSTPIDVTAISHEIVSPRDPATGLPTGKRQHKPITITKEMDKTSPLLLQALFDNENLTSVLIALLRDGQQVATIKLTNASVASYDEHGQTESLSFTYQKITWTWTDGGVTAQDDWNTSSNG
jgi:type VI secretion system secreted protein Hcp